MAEITWTAEAERWLKEIQDYIAQENPAAADAVLEAIHSRVAMLRQFPQLGQRHTTRSGLHIRVLVYGHYRIAYKTRRGGDVAILGVFHGAVDIDRYLF